MALCSVLMSVYNEKLSELNEAVESVLRQSFDDYEFIIVCDNPDNLAIRGYLAELAEKNDKVHVVYNEKNMGLALSLNTAAMCATGKYIIRMDADDISMPDRFKSQVSLMENSAYDLLWSSYEFINENGVCLNKDVRVFKDKEIPTYLPHENIVHHPTVMMKRSVFEDAGGYRKFPCAQDYDLWLRMLYNGCKMHMMPEKLLKYRVRESSTSGKKKYMQLCTLDYIRSIYKNLEKNGKDVYSYEKYTRYLEKSGVGEKKIEDRFQKAQKDIEDGKVSVEKGNYLIGLLKYTRAMLESPFYRKHFILWMYRSTHKNRDEDKFGGKLPKLPLLAQQACYERRYDEKNCKKNIRRNKME